MDPGRSPKELLVLVLLVLVIPAVSMNHCEPSITTTNNGI